jgi:hypothetical protein
MPSSITSVSTRQKMRFMGECFIFSSSFGKVFAIEITTFLPGYGNPKGWIMDFQEPSTTPSPISANTFYLNSFFCEIAH